MPNNCIDYVIVAVTRHTLSWKASEGNQARAIVRGVDNQQHTLDNDGRISAFPGVSDWSLRLGHSYRDFVRNSRYHPHRFSR